MAAEDLSSLSKEEFSEFLNSFDTVLTDCDGVLWLDSLILQGSPEVMNSFKSSGKRVFYVSNNSTKTRKELLSKCIKMGFNATEVRPKSVLWIWSEIVKDSPQTINKLKELGKRIFYVTNNSTKTRNELFTKSRDLGYNSSEDEVVSTAYLVTRYLKKLGFNKKAYVIGSTGITQEMDMAGIRHSEIGPDPMPASMSILSEQKLDPEVGAVVVGFDEHFSYPKMLKGASYLARKDCLFVATNTDEQFPMSTELIIPGTGSFVRSVETCAGRKAFVVGKPHSYISDFLVGTYKIDPKRTIMIGDRCNTDILLGTRCGFKTLLVLSGVSTLEDVNKWKQSSDQNERDLVPDYYIGKLGDLLPMLN